MFKVLLWAVMVLVAGVATAQAQPCASRLFVSGFFSTVHVFDACTGAYLRDLDSNARIRGPQAVRLGPNGNIFVVSETSQQILEYRNDTLEFVRVFAGFSGIDPTGIAFGPSGDVFVAAFKTDEVRRLSSAGVPIDTPVPTHTSGVNGPDNGMTFGPDGNLYIPGFDSSTVARYDPRTGITTVVVAQGAAGLLNTRGILPDRSGTALLITGEGSGQLLRFDLGTGVLAVLGPLLTSPTGIDYGPDGNLLILESDKVRRFDPSTGALVSPFVPAGSGGIKFGTFLAVIPLPAGPAAPTPVIEFYNAALDHYFVSSLPADIDALDTGKFKGWVRTGLTFNAYAVPVAGTNPVCRFYLPPANGDSHFYSASPAECAEVKVKFPSFDFEAPDVMHIGLPDPVTGACPPDTVTVYRLWNNRADSNHRYTSDLTVKAAMLAKGYIAEGYGPDAAIMCAAM